MDKNIIFHRHPHTSERPSFHLGCVLSFVTDLEIHGYMANFFSSILVSEVWWVDSAKAKCGATTSYRENVVL